MQPALEHCDTSDLLLTCIVTIVLLHRGVAAGGLEQQQDPLDKHDSKCKLLVLAKCLLVRRLAPVCWSRSSGQ